MQCKADVISRKAKNAKLFIFANIILHHVGYVRAQSRILECEAGGAEKQLMTSR